MSNNFRALDALTSKYPPLLHGRQPYWRPKTPSIYEEVRIPSWDWAAAKRPQLGARVATLDINGAFIAPLSGTELAHGALEHTGGYVPSDLGLPGYYKVRFHQWADSARIPSPLGMAPATETVWITHCTLQLLHQLTERGEWPECEVLDSWTANKVRPSAWAMWIRGERAAALMDKDKERYEAIKHGYSIAVQMMLTQPTDEKVKSKIHRPDWHHAIRSQHFANTWRKAKKALDAGHGPLVMGNVDEMTFSEESYRALFFGPKPVLRLDSTGTVLGALKVKYWATVVEDEA